MWYVLQVKVSEQVIHKVTQITIMIKQNGVVEYLIQNRRHTVEVITFGGKYVHQIHLCGYFGGVACGKSHLKRGKSVLTIVCWQINTFTSMAIKVNDHIIIFINIIIVIIAFTFSLF